MKQYIIRFYTKIPRWIKNRYFLSVVIFCTWIIFFDTNSILVQANKQNDINKLESDIEYYIREIEQDQKLLNIIRTDSLTLDLEKYFREVLFLSKKNEEVFIIE
ncbi:MAG: septum formation initiator [Flavobacteriales bacterium]|nr:septum formation initiator [Flavobacteriales bacterium]|tara:strand:+ start:7856 stop:8167 length:312 start_codon:yes stop_codon:yes gene_type:complete